MGIKLSPQEILKIAVRVEENGQKLYEALEKKAADEKSRKVWQYLKVQETEHKEAFQRMLDNIGDYIVPEFSPGEYEAYLKAIASSYVFTQELIEKRTKELFTADLEAVEFGINIEKESVLVYSALKEYVLADKQPVLDKVIKEEKEHLVQLTLLKEQIADRG